MLLAENMVMFFPNTLEWQRLELDSQVQGIRKQMKGADAEKGNWRWARARIPTDM